MKYLTTAALALAAALAVAHAGFQVVLEDGQVLEGIDVRRDGDLYLIELATGDALTIPVALVRQVRVIDDKADETTPDGLHPAEPRQLAGDPVRPLTVEESQRALGQPSRFRPSVVDPNWRPESALPDVDVLAPSRSTFREGVIDPTWEPESAFPGGDVLKRSRSTFRESIIANTWKPEDGFEKKKTFWRRDGVELASEAAAAPPTLVRELSDTRTPTRADASWAEALERGGWFRRGAPADAPGLNVEFRVRRAARPSREMLVRACGESVLGSVPAGGTLRAVEIAELDDPRYRDLPLALYAASTSQGGKPQRAVFTVAGGTCRMISGDLRDLLGIPLSSRHTAAQAVEAYNAALGDRVRVRLTSDEAKIAYAFAVVALIDSDVNGHRQAAFVLVDERSALSAVVDRDPLDCSASRGQRKRGARDARRAFATPRVVRGARGEMVEFLAWSAADGEIARHSVYVSGDGKVSLDREVMARHVGEHRDRD